MSRRPGRPAMREERVCPTAETLAKLVRDPVMLAAEDWRHTSGRKGLDPELEQALFAIRRAYSLIVAPVAVRAQLYERRDKGRSEISDAAWKLIERYCDWGDELHRRGMSVLAALELLLDDGNLRWTEETIDEVRDYLILWNEAA